MAEIFLTTLSRSDERMVARDPAQERLLSVLGMAGWIMSGESCPAAAEVPVAVAYLFSRFPFVSQTFTDQEMLGLERLGCRVVVASVHPPADSLRHPHLDRLRAEWLCGPPRPIVRELERRAKADGSWPSALVERHKRTYGDAFKPDVRAANALYFAGLLVSRGIRHVHVPFANRATHTMLFLKAMTGITFSFTTHGQDFMRDLGSNDLLREMVLEAEFVVAVCDYSRSLLEKLCPEGTAKFVRIYNGLDPADFPELPETTSGVASGPLRIVSVGRLIEFKGFHVLIEAVAACARRGLGVTLRIVGEGPWRERLEEQAVQLGVADRVVFLGRLGADGVRDELARADVFALGCVTDEHGVTDLLPTVITEAMLSSLPVVSTRLAGVPEMVEDGVTGLLAEPGDADGLADAFQHLAGLTDRGRAMGAAGRQRALELFTLDKSIPLLAARLAPHAGVETGWQPPRLLACYDLGLPGRLDWLEREAEALRASGARLVCALPDDPARWKELAARLPDGVEFLPDGMVIEMEWSARTAWRRSLEAIRTAELGAGIDGEVFLAAARRAVWLARVVQSSGVGMLYTAGTLESLSAWLASRLVQVRRAVAFDADPSFSRQHLETISAESAAISDGSNKLTDASDSICHGEARHTRIRIGPFSLRKKSPLPAPHQIDAAFRQWLDTALTPA